MHIKKKAQLTNWSPVSQAILINDSIKRLPPLSSVVVEANVLIRYNSQYIDLKDAKE